MKKFRLVMAGLTILLIFITACSSLPGGGNNLEGTAWVLTHIGTEPVLFGSQPTLRFDSGQVSGFGSCNGFGGEYEKSGKQLTFSGIMSTLMACDPIEITQQESAYFAALGEAVEFKIENSTFKIYNDEGTQVLTFSAQDTRLEQKNWQMTSFFDGDTAIISALEGSTVTAQFEDGVISGSAGCNHYSAPYQAKDGNMSIESAAVTEMYCETPAGVVDQETRYLAALTQANTYRVEGSRLTLYDGAGSIMVEFILLP
jgi:heat shock protein HslJ